MTHRLQVRVDRQITPRPGRNITRKWVYERSFSVHLLTQDSLNSHWAFQSASFSRSGYLSVLLACCGAFSSVPPLGLTFWRLCCLDCNTFDYLQDWAVDTETTFHELRVAYCVDYRRVFINTDGRAFCHVPWNVSLLTWMYVKLERCNTGSMLWILFVISLGMLWHIFLRRLLLAGQQNQQPQDYTKAWEEYYKKQGWYSWKQTSRQDHALNVWFILMSTAAFNTPHNSAAS